MHTPVLTDVYTPIHTYPQPCTHTHLQKLAHRDIHTHTHTQTINSLSLINNSVCTFAAQQRTSTHKVAINLPYAYLLGDPLSFISNDNKCMQSYY